MTSYTPKQAMRAFGRIMRPYNNDEARIADAGFDGGEFSGPAHDRMEAAAEIRAMQLVCTRMGVTPDDVLGAQYDALDIERNFYHF